MTIKKKTGHSKYFSRFPEKLDAPISLVNIFCKVCKFEIKNKHFEIFRRQIFQKLMDLFSIRKKLTIVKFSGYFKNIFEQFLHFKRAKY